MQESWHKFIPVEGLSERYSLSSIDNRALSFTVTLQDETNSYNKIYFKFEGRVFSYKTTNSVLKKKKIEQLKTQYGNEEALSWALFAVENSNYSQWVFEGAVEIFGIEFMQHYAFITTDHFLEFIASRPPTVSFTPFTPPVE